MLKDMINYMVQMQLHESVFHNLTILSSPEDTNNLPSELKLIALMEAEWWGPPKSSNGETAESPLVWYKTRKDNCHAY
jgi:hypothetical protein